MPKSDSTNVSSYSKYIFLAPSTLEMPSHLRCPLQPAFSPRPRQVRESLSNTKHSMTTLVWKTWTFDGHSGYIEYFLIINNAV